MRAKTGQRVKSLQGINQSKTRLRLKPRSCAAESKSERTLPGRRFLGAFEAQLAEGSTRLRRMQYSALVSPAMAVSLEGFADGRGGAWRACHGLVGSRGFGEQELHTVAAQVQAAF